MGNHSSLPRFRVMVSSWPADNLRIAHFPRTASTEGESAPLRKCASLEARDNTVSTLETVAMETPCPRPGNP